MINQFDFQLGLIKSVNGFPVTDNHILIIPKRHVGSFFDISDEVRQPLFFLFDFEKANIQAEYQPDDFNIGINDGPVAGQTVPHLHIHLIPRYLEPDVDSRESIGSESLIF
jgi:diadenosine tetraphosphate (Ap4A) HIT family hydrolase